MPKKLLKKRKVIHHTTKKNRKYFSKRGKASFGVLATLVVVVSLGIAFVFGVQKLTPYDTEVATDYSCCDSGNGDACQPNTNSKITVNSVEYGLLKTNIKLYEGPGHLLTVLSGVVGLPAGQYVYLNNTNASSEDYWKKYNCDIHGPTPASGNMDTLASGSTTGAKCEAIPNDEIIYVCTSGCAENKMEGDKAILSAYFRLSDMQVNGGPGVPESVKNCKPPTEAQVNNGAQHIILLPSPTGQPNLQLETFYIKSDQVVAKWVSPYCKPAIYLYPTVKSAINVRVNPVGKMLVTTPGYSQNGWDVTAYPSGDIIYKDAHYDYLFYEAAIPDAAFSLPDDGYVIEYNSLSKFLPNLVSKLGLNAKETQQFSEYWLKALPQSPYYQIKIVTQTALEKISPLTITPSPKTVIRVSLHFTPLDKKINLTEPKIVAPIRDGYTVVEWGGIFKRDAKHDFSCLM
jgi:hypothetical protein